MNEQEMKRFWKEQEEIGNFMGSLRDEQSDLADKLTDEVYDGFKKTIEQGKWSRLQGYVNWPNDKMTDVDPKKVDMYCAKIMIKQELESCIHNSIVMYTDHLAGRIFRKTGIGRQPLPKDSEIPYELILKPNPAYLEEGNEDGHILPLPLFKTVVDKMHKQKSVPLVGKIEDGYLLPDKARLDRWYELFDWSGEAQSHVYKPC